MEGEKLSSVELATDLTRAWLGNPNVRATAEDVPSFLRQIYAAIEELVAGNAESGSVYLVEDAEESYVPAVSVRRSLASSDHIISMIDGKSYKTLRRHLASYGLTPEEYRARYNLRPDYPMVAPSYSEQRRAVAKQLGLGRHGRPKTKGANAPRDTGGALPAGVRGQQGGKTGNRAAAAQGAQAKRRGRPRKQG